MLVSSVVVIYVSIIHWRRHISQRGIDVLLEIDTPGHTAIIAESHPEHIACKESTPWGDFAAEPPAGQLRLASPETQNFTASLLSSIAKVLPSKLFSTGGDELNTKCYTDDAQTQADLKSSGKTLEQALDDFTQATHRALINEGKTPVVWEGLLIACNIIFAWPHYFCGRNGSRS